MYSGGYSPAKFSLDAKKMHKSKGKSCGYYWRIIFFFSSLIQSLIIVSLVLFMVYGHPEQSSEEKRVQDLQQSFMQLTAENKLLLHAKRNLTRVLNITLTKKLSDDRDLLKLRKLANMSSTTIITITNKLYVCEMEKRNILRGPSAPAPCSNGQPGLDTNTISRVAQLQAMYRLLVANFTQTVQHLNRELDGANGARDTLTLEAIGLRRNTSDLQRQLVAYGNKCKGDFVQSLDGIQAVTRAFMGRIDGLFPAVFPFQLTCEKQRDQLEQIRTNCSSLSREVENKFQNYLDRVGSQVSLIQARSSQLQVQNARLQEDLRWCSQNRTAAAAESRRRSLEVQGRHDNEVERLLKEQKKLRDERELQQHTIAVKSSEITLLSNQVLSLNITLRNCIPKTTFFQPSSPKLPGVNLPGLTKPGMGGPGSNSPSLTKPGMSSNFPSLTKPGMSSNLPSLTKPGMVGTGVTAPGTGSSFHSDLQKHLKELQEMANKDSGVSG
ncbi:hypothetical protein SKAU_G00375890 [Synaphobranchus kaupii]|uniref:Uncharacterized protein n=1 Tax=Synaphobranchus kaupii TaxID=118154 RepID=A0A9Q1ECN5_SYNKA|nr:hypothetical protein SKAU_G00375890 [Synaphobranchus kaupii]